LSFLRDELGEIGLPRCPQVGGVLQYGAALVGFEPRISISRARTLVWFQSLGVVYGSLGDNRPVKCPNDLKRPCYR
jgi:hypothetical protein